MHAQCNARLFSMKELNFQPLGIGIVISGKKGYLTIGKDVVKKEPSPACVGRIKLLCPEGKRRYLHSEA